jgi:hypothetical protein
LSGKKISDLSPVPSGTPASQLFLETARQISAGVWAGESERISGADFVALLAAAGASLSVNITSLLNDRGTYSPSATYVRYDFVAYGGGHYAYINGTPGSGNAPSNVAYWVLTSVDGKSAIATITNATPAAIPAVGQQVNYNVDSSAGNVVDQIVAIGSAATLRVAGIPNATSLLLENIDAPPGPVAAGTKILPSARRGIPGTPSTTTGPAGISAVATVDTFFTIPAFNASVNATLSSTAFLSVDMMLQISGKFFKVGAAPTNATTVSLINAVDGQTGTIAAGSKVVPSGASGLEGASAIATVTGTPPNIPNYNATADYTFESTAGLLIGHYYGFENTSGVLLITAKNGNTITVKNISVTPTTVIATGIKLAPVGRTGASSFAITTNSSNTIVPNIGLNFSLNFEDTSTFPNQGAISIDGIVGVAIVIGKTGNLLTLQNDSIAPNTIIQPARTVFNAGRRGADANISSAGAFTLVEGAAPNTSANQMGIYVDPVDKRLKKREQSNGVSSLMIGVIYAPTTSPPIGSSSYDWVATDIDEKHYWKPTGNAGAGIWVQYTG